MKGFLAQSFKCHNGCHFLCGHYLGTLLRLLSKEHNPHAEKFIRVVTTIPTHKLKDLEIATHIESAGIRSCRMLCFEFLTIYMRENSKFDFSMLLKHPSSLKAFKVWQNQQARTSGVVSAHQLTKLEKTKTTEQVDAPEAPPAQVFSQSCSAADLCQKQSNFQQRAQSEFDETRNTSTTKTSKESLQTKVDVVNHDMAFLRLTVPVPLDKQFGRHSGLDIIRMKRAQTGDSSPSRSKGKCCFDDAEEDSILKSIFQAKYPTGDTIFAEGGNQARFVRNRVLEVRLRDKERTYLLEFVLDKFNFLQPNGSLLSLKFKSTSSHQDVVQSPKEATSEKCGSDSGDKTQDNQLAPPENCMSGCSTGAESLGSAIDLEGLTPITGLDGSLEFKIRGGNHFSPKSAELVFELLLSSRDKVSQELLQRADTLESSLLKLLSSLFTGLAQI